MKKFLYISLLSAYSFSLSYSQFLDTPFSYNIDGTSSDSYTLIPNSSTPYVNPLFLFTSINTPKGFKAFGLSVEPVLFGGVQLNEFDNARVNQEQDRAARLVSYSSFLDTSSYKTYIAYHDANGVLVDNIIIDPPGFIGLITEFPVGFLFVNSSPTEIFLGICTINGVPTVIKFNESTNQLFLITLTGEAGYDYTTTNLSNPPFPINMTKSGIASPASATGYVFYNSDDGTHGQELWITDGSVAGTHMVKDIKLTGGFGTPSHSYPSEFTPMNNKLYFSASSDAEGLELWVSDGTEIGTTIVKDINPSGGSSISNMININNMLYFSANNGTDGSELWKSDGTTAGTIMIKDINLTSINPFFGPAGFTLFKGLIYFGAYDVIHGYELWVTDGTENGTNLVKNINNTGDGSAGGVLLTPFLTKGDVFYFYADDGIHGKELWISDGTREGTQLAYDLNPGPDDSNIYGGWGKIAGDNLYLSATDGVIGYELFIFENVPTTVPTVSLSMKVFLEGGYVSNSMSTNLTTSIPLNQPFNNAEGNYYGDESISSTFAATHNIVDWVVVELRTGPSAAEATTIVAQKAVLVNSDGDLVDLDGSLDIDFKWVEAGDYYVTVIHRNHLSVLSSGTVTLTN